MSITFNKALGADPYFNNVSLLMHMDGANGSTTFTDSSKNNFIATRFGNTQISTTISKFGDGAGYFDGNGDYLALPINAIQFNADDFTIEFWVYPTRAGIHTCVANWGCGSNMTIFLAVDTDSGVVVYLNGSGPYIEGGSIQVNQWQHVALVRQGSNMRAYINGVQAGNTYNIGNTPINTIVDNIRIGRDTANFNCNPPLEGYIDDLRITKGVARYNANFAPPTEPFPNINKINTFKFLKGGNKKIKFSKFVFSCGTTFVSNAGTSSINGAYIPFSTVTGGDPPATYTIWTKDGLDSYPRILPYRAFSTLWRYAIVTDPGEISFQTVAYYGNGPIGNTYWDSNNPETVPRCPSNATSWVIEGGSGLEPPPTVTN